MSQPLPCPQLPAAHCFLLSHLSHVYGIMEQLIIWDSVSMCVWEYTVHSWQISNRTGYAGDGGAAAMGVMVHDLKFSIWDLLSRKIALKKKRRRRKKRKGITWSKKVGQLSDRFSAVGHKGWGGIRSPSKIKWCVYPSQLIIVPLIIFQASFLVPGRCDNKIFVFPKWCFRQMIDDLFSDLIFVIHIFQSFFFSFLLWKLSNIGVSRE